MLRLKTYTNIFDVGVSFDSQYTFQYRLQCCWDYMSVWIFEIPNKKGETENKYNDDIT